jgi:hypothetical protein
MPRNATPTGTVVDASTVIDAAAIATASPRSTLLLRPRDGTEPHAAQGNTVRKRSGRIDRHRER